MAFVEVPESRKKVSKKCTACGVFKTKSYSDNLAGREKMNKEADGHYQKCLSQIK